MKENLEIIKKKEKKIKELNGIIDNLTTALKNKTINVENKYNNQEKNENIQKNCTFRPKLYKNFKYKNISSNYKNDIDIMNRIKNELNEKIEKIDKIKKTKKNEIEYNFSPEINDSIPKSNKTVLHIKGVPKYLSNMEKSRQKKRQSTI